MEILEQILQEIDKKIEEVEKIIVNPPADSLDKAANDTAEAFIGAYKGCQDIIRSHMEDEPISSPDKSDSGSQYINIQDEKLWDILFEEACVEGQQADRIEKMLREICVSHMEDDGWIPVEERLPENAQHKGAFCPKYDVMTKYGKTEGWYNPDFASWYVLIWFMTDRFLESEIDFERGDVPKVVKVPLTVEGIVLAWKPLPAPYQTEEEK